MNKRSIPIYTFLLVAPILGFLLTLLGCVPVTVEPTPAPTITTRPQSKTATPISSAQVTQTLTETPAFAIPYEPEKWNRYVGSNEEDSPHDIINKIAVDRNGIVWATSMFGVYRLDGQNSRLYTIADGLWSDRTTAIALDSAGQVWVASYGLGRIVFFDGLGWKLIDTPDQTISSILVASDGQVWFGGTGMETDQIGAVSRFDGHTWDYFGRVDGLLSDSIRTVVEDLDGTIWAAASGWVYRFDGNHWQTSFSHPNETSGNACLTVSTDGSLWFASLGGFYQYLDGEWVDRRDNAIGSITSLTATDDGNIWIGMFAGSKYSLAYFDGNNYWGFENLPFETVLDIAEGPDGRVWFATNDGIYVYSQ